MARDNLGDLKGGKYNSNDGLTIGRGGKIEKTNYTNLSSEELMNHFGAQTPQDIQNNPSIPQDVKDHISGGYNPSRGYKRK